MIKPSKTHIYNQQFVRREFLKVYQVSKLNLEESITKRNYLKKPIGETGDQEDAKGQTLKIFHFTPAVHLLRI